MVGDGVGGAEAAAGASPEVAPVRAGEELDARVVDAWVRERLPGPLGPLEIRQFPGGHANLTYLLRFGERELVLRRPPLGPVAPGAHDMAREYRVLSRLWEQFPRAPRAYLFCDDEAVIGAPFFVMERRRGVVVRSEIPPEMRHHPDVGRRTSFALIDALAELHAVDYAAAGLAELGKPQGFAERQLAGWHSRWHLAKHEEVPSFDEVHARLVETRPVPRATSLIHNDPKLDNCQFDPANPDRVTAIFDWDMATLGDPLFDVGTLLGYWLEPGDGGERTVQAVATPRSDLPSRRELAERYAARRDVPLAELDWYEAFALWRAAVVLQQIYIRYQRGQTRDERFAGLGEGGPALVRAAAAVLERRG